MTRRLYGALNVDAEVADGVVRGIASTYGNADHMQRAFRPGAFGSASVRVPFLLNHDDDAVIGESVLTPTSDGLRHESRIIGDPRLPKTGVAVRSLIRNGLNSTSIGWVADPRDVEYAEGVTYYNKATLVENSLVPIPANPRAVLDAASLTTDRETAGFLFNVLTAAGRRHSESDMEAIQSAHDAIVKAGAVCGMPDSGDASLRHQIGGRVQLKGLNSLYVIGEAGPESLVAAIWSTSYINDLPDSAFLHIEDGGEKDSDGKTTPRSLRHFPYKDASGKVDLPHLRNALSRIPQSDLPADVRDGLTKKAQKLLDAQGGQSSVRQLAQTPAEMIQAVDAAIDEALAQLAGGNSDQAQALLQAADTSIDALMDSLGISDPDEDEDEGSAMQSRLGKVRLLAALAEYDLAR